MANEILSGGKLYAIYKDAIHKGNSRAKSKLLAIKKYLVDSGFSRREICDLELLKQYIAAPAVKGIHYL